MRVWVTLWHTFTGITSITTAECAQDFNIGINLTLEWLISVSDECLVFCSLWKIVLAIWKILQYMEWGKSVKRSYYIVKYRQFNFLENKRKEQIFCFLKIWNIWEKQSR